MNEHNDNKNNRVLLVEDYAPNIQITTSIVRELGYEIDVAESGDKALEKFRADPKRYAVLLMDLQMPDIDGLEITRLIRIHEKEYRTPPVPIIAITGNATEDDRIICKKGGMDDYLSKPFRFKDLEEKLAFYTMGASDRFSSRTA